MILQERIQQIFDYDPLTGIVTNRIWRCRTSKQGDRAGTVNAKGYRQIYLSGTIHYEHRLIWYYLYGYWPEQIDHINGERSDNRLVNLREATNQLNCANSDRSTGLSGLRGVIWIAARHKWRAGISVDGRSEHLGYFDTAEAAHSAYLAAADLYFGAFAYHNRPSIERTA